MIQLQSVTVSNFKAFGQRPTTLDLSTSGTCLIIGNNLDVGAEGESRNGVSKTSILEAVVFALYGKGLNKNRPDDMVNYYNERNMVVELKLNVGGVDYVIRRGRKPNLLTLKSIVDGEEVDHTRDSLKNTDAAIRDAVGVSYDIYLSVFFMNPWRPSFMSMSGVEQRSFMEQLLSLDTLAARAETLKKMRKELTVDIKLAEKDLDHATRTHEQAVSRFERAKSESEWWVGENAKMLEEARGELTRTDGVDFDAIIKSHDELTSTLEETKQAHAQKVREIEGRKNDATMLRRDVEKALSVQRRLMEKADSYMDEMGERLRVAQSAIPSGVTVEGVAELEDVLREVKETRAQLERRKSDLARTVSTTDRSIARLESAMGDVRSEIESLESGVCPYCSQSHIDADKVASLKEKIRKMSEEELAEMEKSKTDAEGEISDCDDQLKELDDIEGEIEIPISSHELDKRLVEVDRINESMESNPHAETLALAIEEAEGDVSDLEEMEKEVNAELGRIEEDMAEVVSKNANVEDELKKKIKSVLGDFDSISSVKSAQMSRTHSESKLRELEEAVNPYAKLVEESVIPDIEAEKKTLEDLQVKETHVGYLIRLLTDSKSFIRKNIVDQYMPFINKKIVEYTAFLDLPHVPMINADMTVEIEYMGKDVSYHSMSRGEQLRLDVATSMAFKDLLEVMGVSCNVLMLDEIFDSAVDQSGIRKMFRLVKNTADHVLLISHREEFQSMVDSTLLVTKSNSFASLKLVDRV